MKIVFCWPSISGYMAACWRELADRPGVDVHVIGLRRAAGKFSDFQPSILDGLSHHLLDEEERVSRRRIRDLALAEDPDVLVLAGWQHKPYVPLAFDRAFRGVRRIMMIDNAYRGDLRQRLGRLALRPYLARMDAVFVPGERSWRYARWLGVREQRLHRGTYGVDWDGLAPLWDQRAAGGWPRSFLFAGQHLRRKGVDLLAEAYAAYRERVDAPWPLVTAGKGPEEGVLAGRPGVEPRGFVQPEVMAELRKEAAAFVLPSRSDAWPLALVEACAAGLPVICSEACGSAVELVRSHHNGWVIPTGDAGALADALVRAHESHSRLAEMGRASREMAAAYSAQRWADRFLGAARPALQP